MKKVIIALTIATTLTGCNRSCTPDHPINEINTTITRNIQESVAEKVIGNADEEVYSVDPFVVTFITTPGIYNVKLDGTMYQICEFDTTAQQAINGMKKEVKDFPSEIIEDSIDPVRIEVNVLGNKLERPYRKIKVSGFKTERVISGDSTRSAEWIVNNVEAQCTNTVLPRNKPFFVATAVATAYNVETVSGGGLADISVAIGAAKFRYDLEEEPNRRVRNKVFAVAGKLYQ